MAERRQKNSPFSVEEEAFIVETFAVLRSPKSVKNAFIKKFKTSENWTSRQLWKMDAKAFKRVFEKFQKNGIASANASNSNPKHSMHKKGVDRSDLEKVQSVQDFFIEFPMSSLLEASVQLKIPKSTISWILRKKLNMKPYKLSLSQALTAAHKAGRLAFCQWLLQQPEDFVQLVVFGDEKWFHLNQHPNRQNVRHWGVSNPHVVLDLKVQGCAKIMAFVCVCNGKVLPVIWHVGDDGKPVPVNSVRYLDVIRNQILPHLPARKLKKL